MTGRKYHMSLPGQEIEFKELSDEAALRWMLSRFWQDRETHPERYSCAYTVSLWRVRECRDQTEWKQIIASFGTWDK